MTWEGRSEVKRRESASTSAAAAFAVPLSECSASAVPLPLPSQLSRARNWRWVPTRHSRSPIGPRSAQRHLNVSAWSSYVITFLAATRNLGLLFCLQNELCTTLAVPFPSKTHHVSHGSFEYFELPLASNPVASRSPDPYHIPMPSTRRHFTIRGGPHYRTFRYTT